MSTVETISPRTIRAKSILKDLSGEELRALARSGEKTTEYGSPVYATRVKNRSAKKTYVVADVAGRRHAAVDRARERAAEKIREVQEALSEMDLIQVDRRMGMSPEVPLHCRLFVPKEYARIAYMWHNMLFPSDSSQEPDFISVYVPDWPETLIFCDVNQGYTYILGHRLPGRGEEVDAAPGDVLDQAPRRPGPARRLQDPAASTVRTESSATSDSCSSGSPGTGKTTLTLHDHGLKEPEHAIIKQDDVVLLTKRRARLRDRGRLLHQDRGSRAVADGPLGRGDALRPRPTRTSRSTRTARSTSWTRRSPPTAAASCCAATSRAAATGSTSRRRTRSSSSRGATTSCRSARG